MKISMLLLQNHLDKYFTWEFGKYQRFIFGIAESWTLLFLEERISQQTQNLTNSHKIKIIFYHPVHACWNIQGTIAYD